MASARSPCLSASAFSPNSSRRQPVQCRNISGIVGGDAFEVVDGGDDFRGDVMRSEIIRKQHFEQLDDGSAVRGRRYPRQAR